MAMKALNLSDTKEFQSPRDPDVGTEAATTFTVGAIPSRIYAKLKDKATSYAQDKENPENFNAEFNPNAIAYDTVRWGLKGVTNFEGEISFVKERVGSQTYDIVALEFMDKLSLETVRELQGEIDKLCALDGEEVKNLDA